MDSLAINRWWGIPLFGLLARVFVVLPHIIVLSLVWAAVALTWLVLWIPILALGRYRNGRSTSTDSSCSTPLELART
jgi:hypothetical protein